MKMLIVSGVISMSFYASNACEHIKGPVSLLIYAKSMPASPYKVRDGIVYTLALLPCLPQDHPAAQKVRDDIKRINQDINYFVKQQSTHHHPKLYRQHSNRNTSEK